MTPDTCICSGGWCHSSDNDVETEHSPALPFWPQAYLHDLQSTATFISYLLLSCSYFSVAPELHRGRKRWAKPRGSQMAREPREGSPQRTCSQVEKQKREEGSRGTENTSTWLIFFFHLLLLLVKCHINHFSMVLGCCLLSFDWLSITCGLIGPNIHQKWPVTGEYGVKLFLH